MAASSWHILSLVGTLAVALRADAATPTNGPASNLVDDSVPHAAPSAAALQRGPAHQGRTGFVVLHFARPASGEAERGCRQDVKNSARARTLFRAQRTAQGELLSINGHVALRFKASTSASQIDSVIAATGIEVFSSVARPACRRYVFSVTHLEDDPIAIASALQASGLVDYATPDLSAGRPEGIPSDSFFVDQFELTRAITKTGGTGALAPAKYGMGQMLSEYTGPLLRVDGGTMSAPSVISSASPLDLVKSHGLTTLRLEIPERSTAANVRIMLYSLTGTPVRQLVSEALDAGRYIVGWDGKDDGGRRVQPGVYVAVMTAGSFRETRRLVVR